jgi:hypothetical protein
MSETINCVETHISMSRMLRINNFWLSEFQVRGRHQTVKCDEGRGGGVDYSCTLFLTYAPESGGWSTPTLGDYPLARPGPISQVRSARM